MTDCEHPRQRELRPHEIREPDLVAEACVCPDCHATVEIRLRYHPPTREGATHEMTASKTSRKLAAGRRAHARRTARRLRAAEQLQAQPDYSAPLDPGGRPPRREAQAPHASSINGSFTVS